MLQTIPYRSAILEDFWALVEQKVRPQWTQFGLGWMALALAALFGSAVSQLWGVWMLCTQGMAEDRRGSLLSCKARDTLAMGALVCALAPSLGVFSFFYLLEEGERWVGGWTMNCS